MKIGIVGFGKTGRTVAETMLETEGICLEWVLRRSRVLEHRSVPEFLGISHDEPGLIYSKDEYSAEELLDKLPVDVIVDFSSEAGLDYYGETAANRGITIISAVSEYPPEQIAKLRAYSKETVVLYSPNMTVGINFLIIAARILKKIAPYTDIEIIEEHFKTKPEVSGTAKVIAKELDVKSKEIKTVRAGGIIGIHEIIFGFPFQTVRLKHESITRQAFGNGVLFAIENLKGRKKGFYTMDKLMEPYFRL